MYYRARNPALKYAAPSTKLIVLGAIPIPLAIALAILANMVSKIAPGYVLNETMIATVYEVVTTTFYAVLGVSVGMIVIGVLLHVVMPNRWRIYYMIRVGLFCAERGNPLGLREGELLPRIKVYNGIKPGRYAIYIYAGSVPIANVVKASQSISSLLNGRFRRYAVVETAVEEAFSEVHFWIENVKIDKSLHFRSVDEMRQNKPTKLVVEDGTYIDLTTSGSIVCAGKTRSGKTTGVVALLLQILLHGRDAYGSQVLIIDPKRAELSRLHHVVTLSDDGEATTIIDALREFAATIEMRQAVLNEMSAKTGNAVKWWDAGMHVSVVFVDEYVALRAILPRKAAKETPDYCLDTFDNLIKRIVTMGASAGCYVVISIAEASVEGGGLPAMLRSAMSTRILFRPTLPEGRLLWDSDKLSDMPQRVYKAGDAWFSSTDGEHDNVSCVHFPVMDFPVYAELNRLLATYYADEQQDDMKQ